MPSTIIGLGTALPDTVVTQQTAMILARELCCQTERQSRVLEQVYLKSGVQTRSTVLQAELEPKGKTNFFQPPGTTYSAGPSTAERMALYKQQAGPLATTACKMALQDAKVDSSQITHLVTVSCTGFFAPGFDLQLFNTLDLNPSVQRTHVGFMGCHGALNALRVANGFCAEDPDNVVLICATELCSMHFQYGWSRDLMVSNALFADGSASMVLTAAGNALASERKSGANIASLSTATNSSLSHCVYTNSASYVIPGTEQAMTWEIGNSGFLMSLSSAVPETIETNLPSFVKGWLKENELTIADVEGWAVHPGGPRILDAVSDSLELDENALLESRQILAECGNMSSPTVLFILKRMLERGRKPPFVVLGFGPGLTIEAALIR